MARFTVCKTTKEVIVFGDNGEEISRTVTTESSLISSDDTIQEEPKKFMDRETFLKYRKEYLQSAKWQHKRTEVLKRDNYTCQVCGSAKNLNVHHITYDHFGNERLDELITLCRGCHNKAHKVDIAKSETKVQSNPIPGISEDERNRAAENIVCLMLQDKKSLDYCSMFLCPDDMGDYSILYDCICGIYLDNENFTLDDLIEQLSREGNLCKYPINNRKHLRTMAKRDVSNVDLEYHICYLTGAMKPEECVDKLYSASDDDFFGKPGDDLPPGMLD